MSSQPCYHCGDEIIGNSIVYQEKEFCCTGCKGVYQLLSENNLGNFYQMESQPGTKPSAENAHKYNFLDVESIRAKFIEFEDGDLTRINLHLPSIHCSSCIYLLENISKIEPNIVSCQVNFGKREASIVYHGAKLPLSQLAILLDRIGYVPNFGSRGNTAKIEDRQYLYKLGIAGFAFGSIMLWSFPEYLGIKDDFEEFRTFTSYLSFAISIPVLLYSAQDYFISAFKALRYKSLNLDVPITIGIIALYTQSAFTIFSGGGPGYMDSFAGFIFFLLIGKWFQSKTYRMLSFERDYTSYFPLAITRILSEKEEIVEIEQLKEGDTIVLRNDEVLPCDSYLLSDEAKIDYSFVTGESNPITKKKGDFIYAGGRLEGYRVELRVEKESNRSQLTRMWDEVKSEKEETTGLNYQNKLSFYFLAALLVVAGISAIAWAFIDSTQITRIVVSILIVACPCALALSGPFTFGNIMRLLGRKGLYLKNVGVIERLNQTTDIVFDKTGTLTFGNAQNVEYVGDELSKEDKQILYALSSSSTHPMSRMISGFLNKDADLTSVFIENFEETKGKGISGTFEGKEYKLGSADFCGTPKEISEETASYTSFDGKIGRFIISTALRPGIGDLLRRLGNYQLHVISGDSQKDKEKLAALFPSNSEMHFEYSPKQKLEYIQNLQSQNKSVIMVGDGLNDAGALAKADVGIAVSEDVFRFTPSSDAIIVADKLSQLDNLLKTSSFSKTVIIVCMVFSITYNVIGLSFAVTGNLSPLVAAILMPISSITVVFLSTFMAVFRK
jgi:Cu+-exporting ATPase|tara:strand:+ start:54179 stop:56530 length:2352 start_codon:yes stop_codon:yes gene_type:complete